jgi:hypothetical protein
LIPLLGNAKSEGVNSSLRILNIHIVYW